MCVACRVRVLVLVSLAIYAAHARAGEPAKQLVVLGLRPVESATGPTDVKRLAEAQQAPAIVENILGLVSGQDIVGHEQLVKLLGNAYMVDLFRCGDQMACLVAHLKPLQQAGYRTAVYGSY